MQYFEIEYAKIVRKILDKGERRGGRNGKTRSLFATQLVVPMVENYFPILQGRQMYYKGVLGELAAMLRKPKHLEDFEKWGCNYWKLWAKEDGSIAVDYGNAWHADNQIETLRDMLRNDPYNRRMIINGWRPNKLDELDLPCCHLLYQFYVRQNGQLDMMWYQRSADWMIGVPSDIVFAAAWLIAIANDVGYTPGKITMVFGDTHIYEEHVEGAEEYLSNLKDFNVPPTYTWKGGKKHFCEFVPEDLSIYEYLHNGPIKFELKA